MTENPAFESATAVLLDYVEDTKLFAEGMNESVGKPTLFDDQCNFLREPSATEFMLIMAMLPKDGANRFLAAFETIIDQQTPWTVEMTMRKNTEAM